MKKSIYHPKPDMKPESLEERKKRWELDFKQFINMLIQGRDQVKENDDDEFFKKFEQDELKLMGTNQKQWESFHLLKSKMVILRSHLRYCYFNLYNTHTELTVNSIRIHCNGITIYDTICVFLFHISKFISYNLFLEMFAFFVNLIECINEDGFKLEEENVALRDKSRPKDFRLKYCDQRPGDLIPDLVENYILNYYPIQLASMADCLIERNIYPNFYGDEEINLIRLCYFVNFFGKWLRIFEISKGTIDIKSIPVLETPHLEARPEIHTQYP